MVENEPVAKRQRGFVIGKGVPQAPSKHVPKASSLRMAPPAPLPPTPVVRGLLLPEPSALVAVDVETHVLVPDQPKGVWWHEGRFGIDAKAQDSDIAAMHIVQVGWTLGPLSAEPVTKVRLIQPRGFVIDGAATVKHGISQEHAELNGQPLGPVLRELMADAEAVCRSNGRVASHHLAFDGGILAYEMERLGLVDMAAAWGDMVGAGICTMNQQIGQWVRKQACMDDKPSIIPLGLADGIKALLPQHEGLLAGHHDAGVDSRMHWLFARDLIARAKCV